MPYASDSTCRLDIKLAVTNMIIDNNNVMRSITLLFAFLVTACSESSQQKTAQQTNQQALEMQALNNSAESEQSERKQELPNCVLDVEARQIKKCKPERNAPYHGFSGELMIDAIRPDRQWVPTTGIELSSAEENQFIRIIFAVNKWATDEQGEYQVSKTPFIGTIEKWKDKELQWRKPLDTSILPATPFAFSVEWQEQQKLNLTFEQETIELANPDFNISGFAIFGSGVRVSTADLGILL